MSGAFKGIGKVFKKVAMAPIKLAKKVDKMARKVVKKVWQNKIMRMIVIAVAAYFTAGAALAYFGAAAPALTAASTAAVDAGVDVGATAMASGAAVGAAAGGAAVAGGVTDLAAITVTASAGAAGASGLAGAVAATAVGAGAGIAVANAASDAAQGAVQNGNGTVTGAPGGMGTSAASGGTGNGIFGPVSDNFAAANASNTTDLAGTTVTANVSGDVTGASSGLAEGIGAGALAGMNVSPAAAAQSGDDLNKAAAPDSPEDSQKNFLQRTYDSAKDKVTNFFHSGPATAADGSTAAADSSGGMGSFGKVMLLKSAVDFASQFLQKPPEPLQYAGVNKQGEGFGQQLHTVNGGFGLATGPQGTGEQASTGVPNLLRPPAVGSAGSYAASLSNAALAGHPGGSTDGGAGNIGQTVANSAGVGGLVPQGAVNYMGNS